MDDPKGGRQMNVLLTPEDRFRNLQRENSILRIQNLDLMEYIVEQEYSICLLEMEVDRNDL